MRRTLMLAGPVLVVAAGVMWLTGVFQPLADWIFGQQRAVQDGLAGAVRAIKGGQAGAWALLLGVAFSYGVVHAAGPGHGKAVIGGYGVARRVPMVRLAGLALASSLAQAGVAIALVSVGALILGWTRNDMEALAEGAMLPFSLAMVAGLGLWLVWRGARSLTVQGADHHSHAKDSHHHGHAHGHDCGCGHAHGPTLEEAAAVRSVRDGVLVVAAVAMRPCSGALFLLVLTFALGIPMAGIAGAVAMGVGTALVTIGVACASVWLREGAFAALPGGGVGRVLPVMELIVGALIAVASLGLLLRYV